MVSGAQPAAASVATPPASLSAIDKNTGIPNQMKSNLEAMSGFSADDIRVHRNSPKPKEVGAHSYAQGLNVFLGPGREKDLGHELWHTVQQKQGRVEANAQFMGVEGNSDQRLEKEANVQGDKLDFQSKKTSKAILLKNARNITDNQNIIQRIVKDGEIELNVGWDTNFDHIMTEGEAEALQKLNIRDSIKTDIQAAKKELREKAPPPLAKENIENQLKLLYKGQY